MRHHVHVTTIPPSEPRPQEQVETPERDHARTAGREGSQRDKKPTEEGHDRGNLSGPACLGSEAAGQDSAAGASRHEVRDRGEGRRRGRKPGNLMPRPRRLQPSTRSPTMALRARCVSRASSLQEEAGGTAAGDDPHALRHAGAVSALARAWQMNARHTPRRGSPSAPDSLWASRSSGRKRDRCTPGVPQLGSRRPGLSSGHVTP